MPPPVAVSHGLPDMPPRRRLASRPRTRRPSCRRDWRLPAHVVSEPGDKDLRRFRRRLGGGFRRQSRRENPICPDHVADAHAGHACTKIRSCALRYHDHGCAEEAGVDVRRLSCQRKNRPLPQGGRGEIHESGGHQPSGSLRHGESGRPQRKVRPRESAKRHADHPSRQ